MTDRLFGLFREDTALDPAAERALQAALEARGVLPGPVTRAVAALPGPRGRPPLRAPRASRRRWVLAVAIAGVLAAGVILVVRRPAAPGLDRVLDSPDRAVQEAPCTSLALRYQGQGRLRGTAAAPRVDWERGTLAVDLVPGAGTALVVRTREALITVLGTSFSVTRTGPGTTVEVQRGHVRVRCAAGGEADLRAGHLHRCGPASAAGWLALAHQLREAGEPPASVLDAIEAGEAIAEPEGVVRTELLVLRAQVLADAGAHREALAAVIFRPGPPPAPPPRPAPRPRPGPGRDPRRPRGRRRPARAGARVIAPLEGGSRAPHRPARAPGRLPALLGRPQGRLRRRRQPTPRRQRARRGRGCGRRHRRGRRLRRRHGRRHRPVLHLGVGPGEQPGHGLRLLPRRGRRGLGGGA